MVSNFHTEGHGNGQSHAEHEVRDMVSTLTRHLTGLGKSQARHDHASSREHAEDDRGGVSIVTLAGENKGATMKGNLEDIMDSHGALYDDETGMSAYTNSNYQAVNNSIVFGGKCEAEDPGVHVVISDYVENDNRDDDEEEMHGKKKEKDKKEKKKKMKESSKEEDEKTKDSE